MTFSGGTLETTATLSSARTMTLSANGTVQVASGTTTLSGVVSGGHALTKVGSGTLTLSGSNTFSGGTTINAGTLDLEVADTIMGSTTTAGGAGAGAITFAGTPGSGATLALGLNTAQPGNNATFGNTLASFGANDALDLVGLTYTSGGSFTAETFTSTGAGAGTLAVTENGRTEDFSLSGVSSGTIYYAHQDSAGTGTMIDTVCYCTGTLIRTVQGDVVDETAVEALKVGDLVVTASNAHRPIR